MMLIPDTRFVRTADGVYIAYQAVGDAEVDVAVAFNTDEGNVDLMWDEPDWRPYLIGSLDFARVILHDRRATGVSSRNVPPPNLETQVADLLAVLDAAQSERPVLVGGLDGGQVLSMFAATHPDRVKGIVWNNPAARTAWAPDYPWGRGPKEFEHSQREVEAWGTMEWAEMLADFREAERRGVPLDELGRVEHDRERIAAYARIVRNTAAPDVAAEINRIFWETDVRGVLPSVTCPVALVAGKQDNPAEAEYVASLLPNATVHIVEGRSGVAVDDVLRVMRELAGVRSRPVAIDTVLATVLFTDIVDSTARQAALGDRAWRDLVGQHNRIVREALARWRGVENDTAGDGFFATFDGPARAIRCALEVVDLVAPLGIEIRAGLHTGECEIVEGKAAGIAVSIGARVASTAGPSQVHVTQTVKDLVAGSGLSFADLGEHVLKGVPDSWRVYRVSG
jgi:class 3 adenylate cyclase/pimeloyl-ACP methyl ester carboxylesterase